MATSKPQFQTGRVRSARKGYRLGSLPRVAGIMFLVAWNLFSILGFLWIMMTSLKSNQEFFSDVWAFFQTPHWENYEKVWVLSDLKTAFFNSVLVVVVSVLGILAVSAPAAYVLSRFPFRGRGIIANAFTLGMGVPYQLLLVPLFFLLFHLGLIDNLFGLIIVYVALSLPFTIFLLLGFFRSLPSELEEAAAIDGCTPGKTFLRIMLPLGAPGLLTAGIFNFVFLWNEFLLALTLLSSNEKFTLSLGLYGLQGTMQYTGDWVGLFAGFTVVMLPSLLVYAFLSTRIIEGMTLGAMKG